MDDVIAGYRNLTGQAPMYGKWAYGYWQSKEHYATRDELLGIAQEYRTRQIPIDGIVQDWNYWGGNTNWSSMFFDEKTYPNPKEMIDILHRENFHLMISIWTGSARLRRSTKTWNNAVIFTRRSAGPVSNITTFTIRRPMTCTGNT